METANGYVFGGYGTSAAGMLTGTDFSGNVVWAAQYGLGPFVNTYKYSKTSDGGYITTGNYAGGSVVGLMLMKTDADGVVACDYFDAISVTTGSPVTFGVTSGCAVSVVMPTAMFATVIDANPAPDDTVVVCNTLSLTNLDEQARLHAYPTPANETVTLVPDVPFNEKGSAIVIDAIGRTVLYAEVEPFSNILKLDVSQLACGAYVVSILSRDKNLVRKISVQR
jgi:hypothetical protein